MLICANKCNNQIWSISYSHIPSCERSLLADVGNPDQNQATWTDYRGSYRRAMCFTALTDVSNCMTSHSRDAPHSSQSHQSQSKLSVPNNFNNSRAITEYKLITITQDLSNLQPREENQATTGVLWVSVWRTHFKVSSLCFIFSQLSMLYAFKVVIFNSSAVWRWALALFLFMQKHWGMLGLQSIFFYLRKSLVLQRMHLFDQNTEFFFHIS